MNKKERVDAALRGDPVDRVPVSMWSHDFAREWSVQDLVEATAEHFTRYDWDFVKVNPRTCYLAEAWGAYYKPSGEKHQPPVFERSPIRSTTDWKRLRPREADQGVLGEQLLALQMLNHVVGHDAYLVQTISCPLGVAKSLVGNVDEPVLHSIREDRKALHTALRVITETLAEFAIACMEAGAHGIFYTTNGWARSDLLTKDQYREFGEQYDLELMDAIKSRSKFTILHNCGTHIYFDLLASYPVHALSWAATLEGNPDLREGKQRSGKAVMGGISEQTVLKNGSAAQVQEEVARARELTGDRHVLLAPGCSVPPGTPAKNFDALQRALS
ncbi:MAG: hypothetical protein J2P37_10070 [Ktedonobacteraceae bacterium]|nr:hypothetical protein [Ktedonobacteraceae bacterium]